MLAHKACFLFLGKTSKSCYQHFNGATFLPFISNADDETGDSDFGEEEKEMLALL